MLSDHKPVSDTRDTASVQNKLFQYTFDGDSTNCQEGLAALVWWCFFFGSTYLPTKVLKSQSHWDSVPGMVLNPFLSDCYLSIKL